MSAESHAEILRLLKETSGGYLSSARLSAQLGISRAAIWKQVGALREHGYKIDALPSKGYRLAAGPDRLLSEEIQDGLQATIIGRAFQYKKPILIRKKIVHQRYGIYHQHFANLNFQFAEYVFDNPDEYLMNPYHCLNREYYSPEVH
jgi:biotin operon repressor BirA-like protein